MTDAIPPDERGESGWSVMGLPVDPAAAATPDARAWLTDPVETWDATDPAASSSPTWSETLGSPSHDDTDEADDPTPERPWFIGGVDALRPETWPFPAGWTPDTVAKNLADLISRALDEGATRWAGRPIKLRTRVSPAGLLRGQVDMVRLELQGLAAGPLIVDRLVVKARRVRIAPGLPPRLQAAPVELMAYVNQDSLDDWTRRAMLPFRLVLTEDNIVARAGVRGFQVGEVEVDVQVEGQWLALRPRRANVMGFSNPLIRMLRGYLPLPPLPFGVRLTGVDVVEHQLRATLVIDEVDEPLTPEVANRLRKRLRLPLLNLLPGR